MTAELVSRLLAAIEEKAAIAREATKWSAPEWGTASSAVLDLGIPDLDGLLPVPASPIGHHMEANDPASVLRLCEAHRDIVDEWAKRKQMADQLAAEGYVGDAVVAAEAIVAGLWAAVTLAARGYGIEDGEDKEDNDER